MLDSWRARAGGATEIHGEELRSVVGELLSAYTPADLRLELSPRCRMRLTDDRCQIRIDAALVAMDSPAGLPSPRGQIRRTLDTGTGHAEHELLVLPLELRAAGRGRDSVRRSVDVYRELGIQRVLLESADFGRYVWAMCGFDYQHPRAHAAQVAQAADRYLRKLSAIVGRPLPSVTGARHPWEIAMLDEAVMLRSAIAVSFGALQATEYTADHPDEAIDVGKAAMLLGAVPAWPGILRLEDDDLGYSYFRQYTRIEL